MTRVRKPAVAGTWYPGTSSALGEAVDRHLARAKRDVAGELVALVAPHAGLMYSGPVAAHAYHLLQGRVFDVAVLVGPSHYVGFDGVALYPGSSGFETPYGVMRVDDDCAKRLRTIGRPIVENEQVHQREHSIEMQLPFLQRLAPDVPIVALLMGHQTDEAARMLAGALVEALTGRRALIVASTDLSHYHDAATAARLDRVVIDRIAAFDPDGLQNALTRSPEHACGGGPTVAVMRAAQQLGARDAIVLDYADSGDVSGDKSAVVGYVAAALGTFVQ